MFLRSGYQFIRNILLLLLLFIIASCGSSDKGNENPDLPPVQPENTSGVLLLSPSNLISKINCPGNPSLSIAAYTPDSYSTSVKYPVIIFFDPEGNGVYPLQLYRSLADEYGYLLVASNDSKNGLSREAVAEIVKEVTKTVVQLLPVDSSRIYTGGFSGGGRIASMLALSPSGIRGLVTCGAGFPVEQWKGIPPSIVVGIAGNSDMNLSELVNLKPSDPALAGRFHFIRYDGGHAWPPAEIMEEAFVAFESTAIREGMKPKNPAALKKIDDLYRTHADRLAIKDRNLEAAATYERWIKSLEGLYDTEVTKTSYSRLIQKPAFQKTAALDQQLFVEEGLRKQALMESVGTKDTSWWIQQMKELRLEKTTAGTQKAAMIARIEGALSLAIYMNLQKSIQAKHAETYRYLTVLYRNIDPQNTEAWYLSAVAAAYDGLPSKALYYLQEAYAKGFKDRRRLLADPAFTSINSDPAFNEMLARITQ